MAGDITEDVGQNIEEMMAEYLKCQTDEEKTQSGLFKQIKDGKMVIIRLTGEIDQKTEIMNYWKKSGYEGGPRGMVFEMDGAKHAAIFLT